MILFALFVCMFGLLFGSFFNVLIWRLPREESVVFPASHCPKCNHQLAWYENIPVISYILLKGKCSQCKERISVIYPTIEIVTCLVALTIFYLLPLPSYNTPLQWILYCVQFMSLLLIIPVSIIDIKHYIIPDQISLSLLVVSVLVSFIPGALSPLQSLFGLLAGGGSLIGAGLLGLLLFKKREAMGMGDVKLMAGLGALWGVKVVLMSIIFGALIGSIIGLSLMAFKKLDNDRRIPFGPFLYAGLWISVFAGESLFSWYLDTITRWML